MSKNNKGQKVKKRMSQCDRTLEYLRTGKSISSIEAINLFGNSRLAVSIFLLRKNGYDIKNNTIYSVNRYGEKCHFVKYYLTEYEQLDMNIKDNE